MSQTDPIKLIPRNVAALRQNQRDPTAQAAGNPVSTRLESGVGNCFPGLECDLRNLERRFFPFLEVDIADTVIDVVSVDSNGVNAALAAGRLTASEAADYRRINSDVSQGRRWRIVTLSGSFGPLGKLNLTVANLRPSPPDATLKYVPSDAWTAVRLLTENTALQIDLQSPAGATLRLTGKRARYLDDNGALAAMFVPGELTQSLCSPWTHDFRDCGCFYWASNHPDIAQPPLPSTPSGDPDWNAPVPWARAERTLNIIPDAATSSPPDPPIELDHYEINRRWQELNFVLEGREQLRPYGAVGTTAEPFATPQELAANLRYAAGVELAVAYLYLTAAYSLRSSGVSGMLAQDITAARAELMRMAISEMRHLRAANDVLASLSLSLGMPFEPALQVARRLPGQAAPWQFAAATPETIDLFIQVEAPSVSVDGLYARILASLNRDGTDEQEQTIRSVIAEGENHYETFLFIQEWLGRHQPNQYLRSLALQPPPDINLLRQRARTILQQILEDLHGGYRAGLPAGAVAINRARTAMVAGNGLMPAAQAVADAGFLVMFDTPADPRFAPIDPPA
jgi:hypothetical protein